MADSGLMDLYKQYQEAQNKYTYFLLAASGSAIAFAVQKTGDATLSLALAPLFLAVTAWCISFYFGCRKLRIVTTAIRANYNLMQMNNDKINNQFLDIDSPKKINQECMKKANDRINTSDVWQFRMLIIGAIFFLIWHVITIVIRTEGLI